MKETIATLESILKQQGIENENGDSLDSFSDVGHDADDFATVSREDLKRLMIAAFNAGKQQANNAWQQSDLS